MTKSTPEMRLEALKAAMAADKTTITAHILDKASKFESYLLDGRPTNNEDFRFTNGDIISFQGENYYRACASVVSKLPDGSTSTCVKRAGHPSDECEDFDGRTARDE